MKKIPNIFLRDWKNYPHRVTKEVNPLCQWVFDGEGIPTRKWDGTACMIRNGKLFRRYDAKFNRKTGEWKPKPDGFEPCQEPDEITGHQPGWILVDFSLKGYKWYKMAWELWILEEEADGDGFSPSNGTYELCGITINGNPEMINGLRFIQHGFHKLKYIPKELTYDSIKKYLNVMPAIEGIVWHHPDGRMAKIKRIDFGLEWRGSWNL